MKTSIVLLVLAASILLACGGAPFTTVDSLASASDDGRAQTTDVMPPLVAADAGPSPSSSEAGPVHEEGGAAIDARVDTQGDAEMQAETGDAGSDCVDDLSHVGAGDFHIEFDMVGVAGGGPLAEQRSTCGQYDVHWLIAETASANIITQFYDGSGGPQLQSVATLNDSASHHVVVARVALLFSITIDGHLDTSVADAVWAPPTLPLIQVGRSSCASPFAGQITNFCLTRQSN